VDIDTSLNVDGIVTSDGVTIAGNLLLGDSNKALFGTGDDLQIYHDGSNSYIDDAGTGDLYIRGSAVTRIQSYAGEDMVVAVTNGAVNLYHNNAKKLETTVTGIDVTGTVTADGLTVSGPDSVSITQTHTDGNVVTFTQSGTGGDIDWRNANGDALIRAAAASRLLVAKNGDISFYEDTGTTPKFFWDASAERLGLGTTNPQGQLAISNAAGTDVFELDTSPGFSRFMSIDRTTGDEKYLQIRAKSIGFAMDGGSDDVTIGSSGNVGIGTSSPSSRLSIASGSNSTNVGGGITFYGTNINNQAAIQSFNTGAYNGDLRFYTSAHATASTDIGAERMRIDSAGNLLVGTTSVDPYDFTSGGGTSIQASGLFSSARDGGTVGAFNRTTSDGDIVQFRKNGTSVGSWQSRAGLVSTIILDPRAGGMGLTGGGTSFVATNNSGTQADGTVDVGSANYRFKDLYLL
jgi:hypothetical protein